MKHKLISITLIAILLCTVLGSGIGCTTPATKYTLTIASTAGYKSITPAVGPHTYAAGTVVNLNATPDSGYRFVQWTAPGYGNWTAAQTTWGMPAQDVTITAHFALGKLIENVPDTNWTNGVDPNNFCAPLAMVNILGYWDEVKGLPNAQNVTAWCVPSNLHTVANLVGYFMDTNNAQAAKAVNLRGNDADTHAGTYAKDILMLTGGKLDYVRWDAGNPFNTALAPAGPALPPGKVGHDWTGTDDYAVGFPFIKTQIDAGKPLVVCYRWWNLNMTSGTNVTDPQSGQTISAFQWGTPTSYSSYPPEDWNMGTGENCIGHAVTGVGYILNWDPDGAGGPLPSDNWTIVHDTWGTTPENIAVPWTTAPWNSSHSVLP
jgi:hypothetical protein